MFPDATLVLLPGMDGTGRMFAPFVRALSPFIHPDVISYPVDRSLGYAELESYVEQGLPAEGPIVLLGESFSGPLALRVAARGHPRLAAVVLVASFARSPLPIIGPWLRQCVGAWCFRFSPPDWIVRNYLAGRDAPDDLIAHFQDAVRTVSAAVMARRAKDVLAVDVRPLLSQIKVPVLLLTAARDRLVSQKAAADFRALGDRLEIVSMDAPHLILQRQPVAAAQAIEVFVRKLSCSA